MNWLRFPITALLMMSLVFSDIATFWHMGNCCTDESHLISASDRSHSSMGTCEGGCRHDRNPFAARRALAAKAVTTLQSLTCDSGQHAPSVPDHEHESEKCSLCRWLVTARDFSVCWISAPHTELSALEASLIVDWVSPAHVLLFQELSRRGPPTDLDLS